MKKNIAFFFAFLTWFAVIAQFYLMLEQSVISTTETTIRFFSYFTILTNTLIAIYFSNAALKKNNEKKRILDKDGSLTAITTYITVVCITYQLVLRGLRDLQGIDRIVDELLHSIIPVLVIGFWYVYENKKNINYTDIPKWLIYPFIYLIYILVRGYYSGFYPYPFMEVNTIGLQHVLINTAIMMSFFIGMSALFVFIGKKTSIQ